MTPLNTPIAGAEGGHKLELGGKGCRSVQIDIQIIGGDTVSMRFAMSKEETDP